MLRALAGLKRPYEPKPRIHHYAGAVRGELLVFAGRTVDFDINSFMELHIQCLHKVYTRGIEVYVKDH